MPRLEQRPNSTRGGRSQSNESVRNSWTGEVWKHWLLRVSLHFAIALATLVAYGNSMNGQFVFDDFPSIIENESIRSVLPLRQSLWGPRDTPVAGRPLVNLSFALNYAAGQLNVFGYHAVNVILHWINTTLLFTFIYRTLLRSAWSQKWRDFAWGIAFVVSSLWALHPIQTETVSYVTQRSELLMAFFFLSTLYSALRVWDAKSHATRIAWQVFCIGCCASGMLCKEVMVVAPIMVLFFDLAVVQPRIGILIKERWQLYLSLAATWGILALLLATNPRGRSIGFDLSYTPLEYMTTQFWAIARYLSLVFLPIGMCGDYGTLSTVELRIWLPCLVLLTFLASLTLWAWFRHRGLSFLGIWAFLILAPTSTFVPIVSEPIAERRMYLPLAAVLMLLVVGVVKLSSWFLEKTGLQSSYRRFIHPGMSVVGFVALSCTYAAMTYQRNEVFRNELAFWSDVTQKQPFNSRGYNNLGCAFYRDNQLDLAKSNFLQAVQLSPFYSAAHANLAKWYAERQMPSEAKLHQENSMPEATSGSKTHAQAYCNLGTYYANRGELDAAFAYFTLSIAMDSQLAEPHLNRGLVLLRDGQLEEATKSFQTAIQLDPSLLDSYSALADVDYLQERFDQAIKNYRIVLERDPQSSKACANLAMTLVRKGDYAESIQWSEKALTIDPTLFGALHTLADGYSALGQSTKAIAAYMQYLSIQPSDASAWLSLGKVQFGVGDVVEARKSFDRVLEIDPNSLQAKKELDRLNAK